MSENRNVPKLRFPEFSDIWSEKKLGEITAKIGSGKTPRGGEQIYTSLGIPFIRSQNVLDSRLVLDGVCIPTNVHEEMAGSKILPRDILLNITGGSIGRSCVTPEDFKEGNVNQHVCIIRLKKDSPSFLQAILSSYRGQKLIFQGQTGSGREGLNFESIKGFKISFPSLPEQQKIAEFLTAVDRRIELLQAKKEKLEAYKKGVMQKIFSQTLRFKAEDGSEFPDWEEKKLGEVADIIMGQSPDSKSYNDVHEGLPLVQGNADLKNRKVEPRQWTSSPTKTSLPGDIVMTVRAPVGYIGLNHIKACLGRGICSITTKKSKTLQPFLFQTLVFMEPNWKSIEQGSTFTAVSSSDVKTFLVNLPTLEEQKKIVQFLTSLDRSIENLNQQITHTQTWKKGLLQKMFV
ncbi:restriction endonuclease subunit S [Algoriphagus hitonicola]|uniref:Type I restriction enzyme, S subunit n=1 Tax=Algoriphagus hitonicola TaxID=435880 RepID=A0A1I2V4Y5_9BACT|nr:restriction endonuclease subunit S [Algoriphagus hitonicola]SFG84485.1 type I restriction enzyme, S subunit [Algoriphagus hitonicola]